MLTHKMHRLISDIPHLFWRQIETALPIARCDVMLVMCREFQLSGAGLGGENFVYDFNLLLIGLHNN